MCKQENLIKIPFLKLNNKHQVKNNSFLMLLNREVFKIHQNRKRNFLEVHK